MCEDYKEYKDRKPEDMNCETCVCSRKTGDSDDCFYCNQMDKNLKNQINCEYWCGGIHNLYYETIDQLKTMRSWIDRKYTVDDIDYIMTHYYMEGTPIYYEIPIDRFFEEAKKTWSNYYVGIEVDLGLVIVFKDGGYLKREQDWDYDYEYWEYVSPPLTRPDKVLADYTELKLVENRYQDEEEEEEE